MSHPLATVFLQAARRPVLEAGDALALEGALERALCETREALVDVTFQPLEWVRLWGERLAKGAPELASLSRVELVLVHAVLKGERWAVAHFERVYVRPLEAVLLRRGFSREFADEVLQATRERLLVGTGLGPPKLTSYLGSGSLAGWLRVVVVRVARNLAPDVSPAAVDEERLLEEAADVDLELIAIRERYRDVFHEVMRAALAEMAPQEVELLRYAFLDGLPVEHIARLYGVHRTTVSRQLEKAQTCVVALAHAQLRQRLQLSGSGLKSALTMLRADSQVSLSRALRAK
jgi:RNA polymerase sigma-70 factor, ECF subfamily